LKEIISWTWVVKIIGKPAHIWTGTSKVRIRSVTTTPSCWADICIGLKYYSFSCKPVVHKIHRGSLKYLCTVCLIAYDFYEKYNLFEIWFIVTLKSNDALICLLLYATYTHYAAIHLLRYPTNRHYAGVHVLLYPKFTHYAGIRLMLYPKNRHCSRVHPLPWYAGIHSMFYPKIRRYVGSQKLLCHKVRHHAGIQILLYHKDRYSTSNLPLLYTTDRHYAGSHILLYPTGRNFTHCNNLTLYKLLIRSILTYAAPVCSSTCSSNYCRLPVIQSKHIWLIGNHSRLTATSHLHYTLNTETIRVIIHRLTAKFFAHCPSYPNSQSNK
jgi:hypothetical protein